MSVQEPATGTMGGCQKGLAASKGRLLDDFPHSENSTRLRNMPSGTI